MSSLESTAEDHLAQLRALMAVHRLDAYLIPSADPHQTEYVHPHWRSRAWLSGFTGSVGTVAVLKDRAGLWTDGRYFIQAEKELEGSGIELFRMQMPGVPRLVDWVKEEIPEGSSVGVDGRLLTAAQALKWQERLKEKRIRLITGLDLITPLWVDRPTLPAAPARLLPMERTGRSTADKMKEIRTAMMERKADVYLIASLYDIAWLFNIRGEDTPHTPLLTAYALVESDRVTLFLDERKISDEVRSTLGKEGVDVAPYEDVFNALVKLPSSASIYVCEDRVSANLRQSVPSGCRVLNGRELTERPRACKNGTELENWALVHEADGVAMVRFWIWLEEELAAGRRVNECTAADELERYRRINPECLDISFNSISAYGSNAAMMHYFPKPETCAELKPEGLYLIDSGGQYEGGTTDITRTLALGSLTDEQCKDYTLVLKGMINLSRAYFLKGSAGNNLDVLARQPLWERGLDYKCGTGHGVGYCLNVHEGPQNFSQSKRSDSPLEPGMVMTVEPGVYKEDRHGVRIENMVTVVEDCETEHGIFYRFESMTLCPIDTGPLNKEMLSSEDIDWLNAYHRTVREKLSPHLDKKAAAWLEARTRPLSAD